MADSTLTEFRIVNSWDFAQANSNGYEEENLVDVLLENFKKNPPGQKLVELFPTRITQLIFALERIGLKSENIKVTDFGGGNGYFASFVKMVFPEIQFIWEIIESDKISKAYRSVDHLNKLQFYSQEEYFSKNSKGDIFIASCAIQYLEFPTDLLKHVANKYEGFILMRLPLQNIFGFHVPTIQSPTDPNTYSKADASYPCWWFNEKSFIDFILENFEIVARWESTDEIWYLQNTPFPLQGMVLKPKSK